MGTFFNLLFLFGVCLANLHRLDKDGSRISQCGGTVVSDSDSLNYPDIGEALQAGEICVWTIHLETTKNFKFNFTSLNVNSNANDCADGGIRIYSLTNLVPSNHLESYSFCDKKPSDDSFYLGENVAVVILYIGSGNTNPGSGFSLSWEGSAFDLLKTKHVSSFSTASNGVIRYPVVGHYEQNLAATWLIKSISMQETTTSDLSLESLELESCGNPDKCTCDALILYEISPFGFLNETQRLCGEISSGLVDGVQSRFIVAFFTDFNTEPSGGGGFEVVYYQPDEATTIKLPETTTYIGSTTPGELISTSCGGVLEARSGYIRYKHSEQYGSNERCIWTIRIPDTNHITFTLVESGIRDTFDGIVISSFARTTVNSDVEFENDLITRDGGPGFLNLNGSVAIVVFYSDESLSGHGFELHFEADSVIAPIYSSSSADVATTVTNDSQIIRHPSNDDFYYAPRELSTFVFAPYNNTVDGIFRIFYERLGMELRCYDRLETFSFRPLVGWRFLDEYCGNITENYIDFVDAVAMIFSTDNSGQQNGFLLSSERIS